MPLSLESLVLEELELERLVNVLNLGDLLACRAASSTWLARVRHAKAAWRRCYAGHFAGSRLPAAEPQQCWMDVFVNALSAQREAIQTWSKGNLRPNDMFVFESYVRSWASDDGLLVAGLYDGRVQPLDWSSGRVGRPFPGRHGDEVTCISLNGEHVLSGSGDPGYYRRPPSDASVKLWRRSDGALLASSSHHRDSVRGVALFPAGSAFGNYALSAGLDAQANLMSLASLRVVASVKLPGPCRSVRVVLPALAGLGSEADSAAPGSEVRVLASAGEHLLELAVKVASPGGECDAPSFLGLRSIAIRPSCLISGIAYHAQPSVWERSPVGECYPGSLLNEPGFFVAGGSVDGQLWVHQGQRGQALHRAFPAPRDMVPTSEVVSLELLDRRRVLAISRCGVLCLVEWDYAAESSSVSWAAQGFRMYVSTMQRREPLMLVSDGFDNVVRTIRAVAVDASDDDADE